MNRRKIISIILMIIWMVFIFIMSSFDSVESGSQSNFIVDIIAHIFNISDIDLVSLIIRKLAHFTEYFILGIFVSNVFATYDKKIYIGIIVCMLYAVSDEVHQLFVPGRSCQALDVLIDSLGSIIGLLVFNLKRVLLNQKLS